MRVGNPMQKNSLKTRKETKQDRKSRIDAVKENQPRKETTEKGPVQK